MSDDKNPTQNHELPRPVAGSFEGNWGDDVMNDDMTAKLEERVPIVDEADERDEYEPYDNAVFVAQDTGQVSIGDGSDWEFVGIVADPGSVIDAIEDAEISPESVIAKTIHTEALHIGDDGPAESFDDLGGGGGDTGFSAIDAANGPEAITDSIKDSNVFVSGAGTYEWKDPIEIPSNRILQFDDRITIDIPEDHNLTQFSLHGYDADVTDVSCLITNKNREAGNRQIIVKGGTFDWQDNNPDDAHTGILFFQNSDNCRVEGVEVKNLHDDRATGSERHHGAVFHNGSNNFFVDATADSTGRESFAARGVTDGIYFIRCDSIGDFASHGLHAAGWPGPGEGGVDRFIAEDCYSEEDIFVHNGIGDAKPGKGHKIINCESDYVQFADDNENILIRGGEYHDVEGVIIGGTDPATITDVTIEDVDVDQIIFGWSGGTDIERVTVSDLRSTELRMGRHYDVDVTDIAVSDCVLSGDINRFFRIEAESEVSGVVLQNLTSYIQQIMHIVDDSYVSDVEMRNVIHRPPDDYSTQSLATVEDSAVVDEFTAMGCTLDGRGADTLVAVGGGVSTAGEIGDITYQSNHHIDTDGLIANDLAVSRYDHINNTGLDDARDDEPSNPYDGMEYLDDGTNRDDGETGYRYYDGTEWIDL